MAHARNTDPVTSHEAAEQAEGSGKAATQRAICLRAIRVNAATNAPELTAAEIAKWSGLERHVPSRRLPELREMGLVDSGRPRRCRVTGNSSMTWWRVMERRELLQQDLF